MSPNQGRVRLGLRKMPENGILLCGLPRKSDTRESSCLKMGNVYPEFCKVAGSQEESFGEAKYQKPVEQ